MAATEPSQPTLQDPVQSTAVSNGKLPIIALAAGIVFLVLLVAGIWIDSRNQIGGLQRELVHKLATADQYNKDSRQLVDQAREAFRALDLKVNSLETRFAETQNQRLALEALYTELSRSRDERVLAEVEQILLIANQQLQLARNVKAALVALESADARLQRSDSAQFTHVRRAIQADIEKLKSAPFVDIAGMGLRIENITNQVDLWPLAMHERPPEEKPATPAPADEGGFTQFMREFWQDARNLIRIQRLTREEIPLLAPSQAFFLKENLKLRLLNARVSLSSQDETSYKSDLREAIVWINRYFDPQDRKVSLALTTLKQLSDSSMAIELPALTASIEAVRQDKLVPGSGKR